jgi:hypothetical protein
MSSKEDCFRTAMKSYLDETGSKYKFDFEQVWVKELFQGDTFRMSKWSILSESRFDSIFYSIKKTFGLLRDGDVLRPSGEPNPIQVRRPDMTITTPTGQQIVVDNKFTRADGSVDPWRTGGQSGSDQLSDYNEINRQHGVEGKELKLDKNVCKCKDKDKPEDEEVMKAAQSGVAFMPMDVPIGAGGAGAAGTGQVPNNVIMFPGGAGAGAAAAEGEAGAIAACALW